MRNWILLFISASFYYSGLVKLARWWTRRSRRYLVILNYHRAAEGDLRRHLLYLCRHFRILHLEMALKELYTPCKEGLQRSDRRTPLVLTFDDGYYDNYTHAFPLARELQVPITLFLIPGYMESGNCFWWMDRLVRHAQVDEATLESRVYHLDQQEERKALAQAIDARISHAASIAEREEFLTSVCESLAVSPSVVPKEEPVPLLKWTEVREMEESGWVSFGAHTMHHPALGYLTDPTEVQREVSECRSVVEEQLGHPVHAFAYPYGKGQYIGVHGLPAVQKASYEWAVTTLYGFNTSRTNPYLLRRVFCDAKQHWLVIAAKASGMSVIAAKISGIRDFFHRLNANAILLIRQHLISTVQR